MRRGMSALLSIVVGTTLAISFASPAHAADANYPGFAGYLNLWEDSGYLKTLAFGNVDNNDLHGIGFNDKASSVVNKMDVYWLLYDDTYFRDRAMCVRPHSHYSKLSDAGFNDKTSSVKAGTTSSASCLQWPLIGLPN